MTNRSSFSVLDQKVRKIKEDLALDSIGAAFNRLALQIILKLNDDEIEDALTDGSMDGGLDAIHIAKRDIHFFNFKYTDDFNKTKNHFPETEVDKIIVTIQHIYTDSLNPQTVNTSIWEKYEEIL